MTRSDKIVETAELCRYCCIDKATKIICGGETRMESVLAGLTEIDPGARLVAVHDGARPLITGGTVSGGPYIWPRSINARHPPCPCAIR